MIIERAGDSGVVERRQNKSLQNHINNILYLTESVSVKSFKFNIHRELPDM